MQFNLQANAQREDRFGILPFMGRLQLRKLKQRNVDREGSRSILPQYSAMQNTVRQSAESNLLRIEGLVNAEVLTIISPMQYGIEHHTKHALESRERRRKRLFVILDTLGGVVEVVERIVKVLRKHYTEVVFVIPDRAMSAGTVLVMSGDAIWMDYSSCLGPIDPQIVVQSRMVPALSYLTQYERLIAKSEQSKCPQRRQPWHKTELVKPSKTILT